MKTSLHAIITILIIVSTGIAQAAPISYLFSGTLGAGGPQVNGCITFDSNDLIFSGGNTSEYGIYLSYTDPAAVISYTLLSDGPFPYKITLPAGVGGAPLMYAFDQFNRTKGFTISATISLLGPPFYTTNLYIESTDGSVQVYRDSYNFYEITDQIDVLSLMALTPPGYVDGAAVGGNRSVPLPAAFLTSPSIVVQPKLGIARGPNNTTVVSLASFAGTNNIGLQWAKNLTGSASDWTTLSVPPPGPGATPDIAQWTNLPPGYFRTISSQSP